MAREAHMQHDTARRFQIVFSDVDGTVLDNHARPGKTMAATVIKLAKNDIPFVLVSGRLPNGLRTVQRQLNFTGPLVCYSGAYVIDEQGNELLSHPLALEDALLIKRTIAAEHIDVCCMAYGYEDWIVDDRHDPRVIHEEVGIGCTATEADLSIACEHLHSLHKLLLSGEPSEILRVSKEFAERFAHLTIIRSSDTLCEVMSKGVSKAEGVQVVCNHFGIALEQALAFGDGDNDIAMLEAVPHSYAMANASPRAASAAHFMTQLSNTQDGLSREINALLFSQDS